MFNPKRKAQQRMITAVVLATGLHVIFFLLIPPHRISSGKASPLPLAVLEITYAGKTEAASVSRGIDDSSEMNAGTRTVVEPDIGTEAVTESGRYATPESGSTPQAVSGYFEVMTQTPFQSGPAPSSG